MIKFIKKWWAEIFMGVGGIIYLIGLVSDKGWGNLIMMILLYLIIGLQTTNLYYQDEIYKIQTEYIELLKKRIREN